MTDNETAALCGPPEERGWRPAEHGTPSECLSSCHTTDQVSVTDEPDVVVPFPRRYGEPSDFGLSPAELAAEIGRCRRSGWFRWECLVRFGRTS